MKPTYLFLTLPISIGWTPIYGYFGKLLQLKLNPWSPSRDAGSSSANQEISHILQNRMIRYPFTRASHLPISSARSAQSTNSHPVPWRVILLLSSHLCLGIQGGLFLIDFPTKTLAAPLLPTYVQFPAYLILLDFITQIMFHEEYRSWSLSSNSFLYFLLPSSYQVQILSSALYSQRPSVCVRPTMWQTKFNTHLNNGKNNSFVLICTFFDSKQEEEVQMMDAW